MLMLADKPRSYARGRMIGRTLDRLEWVADGMLSRLCHGTPEQSGERGKARRLEVVGREPRLAQHLDDGGAYVDGSGSLCHTTSIPRGD